MKVIISHPTGNANVRAAAGGFAEGQILAGFHTSIATFPGNIFDRISSIGPFSDFSRRVFDPALQPVTEITPWMELGRMGASKLGFSSLIKHEKGIFSVDSIYRNLDKKVASVLKKSGKQLSGIYAYEDGASYSFKEAKLQNIQCFYDLPIGYWRAARKLLEGEHKRWPEFTPTLTGFQDTEKKLLRKDEELRLADKIFVASRFTAKTLEEFPGKLAPVQVIPYGFPPVGEMRKYSNLSGSRKIKLLFVGGLSQRKGIADLFSVVDTLKDHVELTIVGRKMGSECPALDAALVKHQWIPSLAHQDVLKLMQAHDILVFPSLFEGFGLVITEAMSQGTPVITTDRTAGPDLITHGENGWLTEAGSTEKMLATFEEILKKPKSIAEAGKKALEAARQRPWEVYGRELAEAIINHKKSNE